MQEENLSVVKKRKTLKLSFLVKHKGDKNLKAWKKHFESFNFELQTRIQGGPDSL